ncbi:MAG: PspC domain-containing protein [Ignavibacteria bacterium]|jgi:phage shock protein PspC (stress-responsive transcriptional regulator)
MKEKLFRSRKNRVLGGVAAGIAEYINLDVIIVRILMIVLTIFNGIGILLYIILWIVLPEEPIVFTTASSANSGTYTPGAGTASSQTDNTSEAKSPDVEYTAEDYSKEQKIHEELNKRKKSSSIVIGIILIIIGAAFTLHNFFYYFDFEYILPLAFIALGIILILKSKNKIQTNIK